MSSCRSKKGPPRSPIVGSSTSNASVAFAVQEDQPRQLCPRRRQKEAHLRQVRLLRPLCGGTVWRRSSRLCHDFLNQAFPSEVPYLSIFWPKKSLHLSLKFSVDFCLVLQCLFWTCALLTGCYFCCCGFCCCCCFCCGKCKPKPEGDSEEVPDLAEFEVRDPISHRFEICCQKDQKKCWQIQV